MLSSPQEVANLGEMMRLPSNTQAMPIGELSQMGDVIVLSFYRVLPLQCETGVGSQTVDLALTSVQPSHERSAAKTSRANAAIQYMMGSRSMW